MRARNIKPGFFKNEQLADIDPLGRLTFIGLWGLADRQGKLEDRPKRICAELFPYDDFGYRKIDKLLTELHTLNLITRYSIDGIKYIKVLNFLKHQKPHDNESKSTIPEPLVTMTESTCNHGSKHLDLKDDCLKDESLNKDLSIEQPIDCPKGIKISDLAKLWNEKAPPELPRVSIPFKRTPKKLKPLTAMIALYPGKDFWEKLIAKIHHSSFLRGKNDRGWMATFDFIVSKADEINDGKYLEGNKGNGKPPLPARPPNITDDDWQFYLRFKKEPYGTMEQNERYDLILKQIGAAP